MISIADLANGRIATHRNPTDFAGRQFQQTDSAVTRYQLGASTGSATHLRSLARPQFDTVNHRARGYLFDGQGVAHHDVGIGTGYNCLAHFQSHRGQDVALLAIDIVQQGNVRRAVGIVLDSRHFRRHADLVPLEIDHPVSLLVAAAPKPDGDPALVVASARFLQAYRQAFLRRFLGNLFPLEDGHRPPCRGCGPE